MIANQIKVSKDYHQTWIDLYSENVRDHVEEYGEAPCDYLTHRRLMANYHRGAWNALNELERNINYE